jgi:hypothetical protein
MKHGAERRHTSAKISTEVPEQDQASYGTERNLDLDSTSAPEWMTLGLLLGLEPRRPWRWSRTRSALRLEEAAGGLGESPGRLPAHRLG